MILHPLTSKGGAFVLKLGSVPKTPQFQRIAVFLLHYKQFDKLIFSNSTRADCRVGPLNDAKGLYNGKVVCYNNKAFICFSEGL